MSDSRHPLALVLDAAARGRFPDPDGRFEVLPPLEGAADALIGFTGHFVLAADVTHEEVARRVPEGDFSVPMSAPFLTWLGERTGRRPLTFDALLCATGRDGDTGERLVPLTHVAHPRVERARRYREDVRVWATADGDGIVIVGHGVCDRWEIGFEVAPRARGRGLGRRLVHAACALVPIGEIVWAQVAPGNAASLRAVIAGGFRPIAAEVLFARGR